MWARQINYSVKSKGKLPLNDCCQHHHSLSYWWQTGTNNPVEFTWMFGFSNLSNITLYVEPRIGNDTDTVEGCKLCHSYHLNHSTKWIREYVFVTRKTSYIFSRETVFISRLRRIILTWFTQEHNNKNSKLDNDKNRCVNTFQSL